MNYRVPVMLAVAVVAAAGGYFAAMSMNQGKPAPQALQINSNESVKQPAELIGTPRPDFELSNTAGHAVTADDFNGSMLLLNFWATWCKPCVEEMPLLSALQSDWSGRGLQIVGIALDDPERAGSFAEELQVQYPILVGRADVVLTGRRYGNSSGMLPFSVLVDRDGLIRWTHLGALQREVVEQELNKLR